LGEGIIADSSGSIFCVESEGTKFLSGKEREVERPFSRASPPQIQQKARQIKKETLLRKEKSDRQKKSTI